MESLQAAISASNQLMRNRERTQRERTGFVRNSTRVFCWVPATRNFRANLVEQFDPTSEFPQPGHHLERSRQQRGQGSYSHMRQGLTVKKAAFDLLPPH